MKCNCIALVEEALSSGFPEAKLHTSTSFPDGKEHIGISYSYLPEGNKRKKEGVLFATYCPFCGEPTGLVPKE